MVATNTQTGNTVMSEETSLAVVTTEIRHIASAIARIESAQQENVTKSAWEQRNSYVDDKLKSIADVIDKKERDRDKDISALWAEFKAKRLSWPAVGAFIIAAVSLLLVIIPKFAN